MEYIKTFIVTYQLSACTACQQLLFQDVNNYMLYARGHAHKSDTVNKLKITNLVIIYFCLVLIYFIPGEGCHLR